MIKNQRIKKRYILGIDTSCDETSVAVVENFKILSNIMPSQTEIHSQYGGVVPSLAKLAHIERIDSVVELALKRARISLEKIDVVAVTYGPGLSIALEVGIKKAKEIATQIKKPLIAINHMEGHLLSSFAVNKNSTNSSKSIFLKYSSLFKKKPALGILISGGHTQIILVKNFSDYQNVGESLDDAGGECLDKCARILGIGYPGGPVVTKFAKENRKNVTYKIYNKNQGRYVELINKNSGEKYILPIPMAFTDDLNFSFSGLKTAFAELSSKKIITKENILDLCSIIEIATYEEIRLKVEKAIIQYNPFEIWLGGGVIASAYLKSVIRKIAKKNNIAVRVPFSKKLTGDNAAMIAIAAAFKIERFGINLPNKIAGIYLNLFDEIDRDPSLGF